MKIFHSFSGFLVLLLLSTLVVAQSESKEKGFLGVQFMPAEDGNGVQVVRTVNGSPANGLLKRNDVILKFDDVAIEEMTQLRDLARKHKPGDVIKLTIRRGNKESTVDITLAKRPNFITIEFNSEDGLPITADLYLLGVPEGAPVIVLCHQAGWSRGEYREIGPKLNELGFRCIAIDQRSGGKVNDVINQTNDRAKSEEKGTNFTDAEQDMIAALNFAGQLQPQGKVILWGSSYSSALALRLAGEQPDLMDGVLAFAPGEYFGRFGKPKDWITTSAKKIEVPTFITSAKNEYPRWEEIFNAIPGDKKAKFVPETEGNHGSRALWEKFDDHEDYWKQVTKFLEQFKDE